MCVRYLLCQPADVFERAVCVGARVAQEGVDVGQHLWQKGSNVCVDGCEPGVSSGPVFTPQHHSVLAVRRVKLQQPVQNKALLKTVLISVLGLQVII